MKNIDHLDIHTSCIQKIPVIDLDTATLKALFLDLTFRNCGQRKIGCVLVYSGKLLTALILKCKNTDSKIFNTK
jgi:hypothetical protein